MHGTAYGEWPEINRDESSAVDQFDYQLFCLGVVAGCEDDGTGFVRGKVLYPVHRHVADGFHEPCADCNLGNHLARCAPLQCGPRSGHASQADVWNRVHMRVRRVDQDAASPINPLESIRHTDPSRGKNDDIAFGCLLLRPCDGAWAEIGDKIGQCGRTSGIRYNLWCVQRLSSDARTCLLRYRLL